MKEEEIEVVVINEAAEEHKAICLYESGMRHY